MQEKNIDPERYREVLALCKKSIARIAELENEFSRIENYINNPEQKINDYISETEQRIKDHIYKTEQKIKNHLAYRLGQVIISQYKKSFFRIFILPFALFREYTTCKKEKFKQHKIKQHKFKQTKFKQDKKIKELNYHNYQTK